MRKKMNLLLSLAVITLITGCSTMSRTEKHLYREIKAYDIQETDETKVKNPYLAAGLNILPGIGNVYLAWGTEETQQIPVAVVNFFFWPYSIIWGLPQAGVDAETINKKEFIYYHLYDPNGRAILNSRKNKYQKQ